LITPLNLNPFFRVDLFAAQVSKGEVA
jgi:hypothetical protein